MLNFIRAILILCLPILLLPTRFVCAEKARMMPEKIEWTWECVQITRRYTCRTYCL
jgi:hypothetical protein